ncbi:MAG TPA: hypothetical protein PLB89_06555 [Flavobacteriales bacterium]|nr:hypothetical protein [Flavobacteriales bacterium]
MDFLSQLQEYYKGERLGAIWFAVVGVVLLLLSLFIWKQSPPVSMGRGLLIPLLCVGLGGTIAGPLLLRTNNDRLVRLPQEYSLDPQAFIEKETVRLEQVGRWWLPLKLIWTVLIIVGLVLAFMGTTPYWKGLGLGLLLIGALGHVVDGFAHERANIYLDHLDEAGTYD